MALGVPPSQRGFTLLEALVAATLVATALVVLAHLAAIGIKQSANARRELVALMAAQSQLERLRVDSVPIGAGEDAGEVTLKWSVSAIEPLGPNAVQLRVCAYASGRASLPPDACVATIRTDQP